MTGLEMSQFLKEYGLILVGASNETIVPGAILDPDRGYARIAYLKNQLEGTNDEWRTQMVEGHVSDNVVWDRSLKGKASLKIEGLIGIGGGLGKADKGTFSISTVKTRVFVDQGLEEIPLRARVQTWSQDPNSKVAYKLIHHKSVVQSTWYASEFTLEFDTARNVDVSADVKKISNVPVVAGGSAEWEGKNRLKVTGNDRVPFAIRAWKIHH